MKMLIISHSSLRKNGKYLVSRPAGENLPTVFNHPQFGNLRTVEINGQPWFVGKDVAEALGYAEPRSAVSKRVEAEDRGVAEMETPSGTQQMTVIKYRNGSRDINYHVET